jgi:transposase
MKERTWDDLPWAAHPVTLVYRQRRVICRRCGIRTERIERAGELSSRGAPFPLLWYP